MREPREALPSLLSEKDACTYLGLSRSSLYRMRVTGQLPFVNLARGEHPLVHDMALLSLGAGMRFGEVAKLNWQDINFVNETALIRDGKGGTDRHAQIKGIVKLMLEQRRGSVENGASGLIFPNTNGDRFSTIPRQYEQAVETLGLNANSTDAKDKVVFHTLRHTFASWLAIRGTPLYTIQRLMGHKSIKVTERYAHLCPDVQATAVEGMLREFKSRDGV